MTGNTIQIKGTPEIPDGFRHLYLSALAESQESFVERLVRTGRSVVLWDKERMIGYATIHAETLVEFFVIDIETSLLLEAFDIVVRTCRVTKSLCKSFDRLMLTAASSKPAHTKTVGRLFRAVRDVEFIPRDDITARRATEDDLDAVESFHDSFFDSRAEIQGYIQPGNMFIYELDKSQAVGCGIFQRILPGRDFVDVRMVVASAHRRQGIGTHIASHLKAHCLREGYRPVCGRGAENTASLRSLERAGFLCTDSLIEFTY